MSDLVLFFFQKDEANQRGGKWIVRLRKGLVSRCWENLVMAMLGEQFMVGEEICGAVVSIRFQVRSESRGCYYSLLKSALCYTGLQSVEISKSYQEIDLKIHKNRMKWWKINFDHPEITENSLKSASKLS